MTAYEIGVSTLNSFASAKPSPKRERAIRNLGQTSSAIAGRVMRQVYECPCEPWEPRQKSWSRGAATGPHNHRSAMSFIPIAASRLVKIIVPGTGFAAKVRKPPTAVGGLLMSTPPCLAAAETLQIP